MAFRLTSSPGYDGLWGPVTSTLDWCESNYQFSYYIAELTNSLTNLITMAVSFTAAYLTRRESLPFRHCVGFLLIGLTAVGSFAFHATLTYQAQLADELPMILLASYSFFLIMDTNPQPSYSPRRLGLIAGVLLWDITFALSYSMIYRNPVYHQTVFGFMIFVTGLRTEFLYRTQTQIPEALRRAILLSFWSGVGLFLAGFAIWNLDNIRCDTITRWKTSIGWPLAFLLEGHAWWHILTGIGSYLLVMGVSCINICLVEGHRYFALGYILGLPYIQRRPAAKAD